MTTSELTAKDHLVHVLARLGVKRNDWRLRPGLYRLGNAGPGSQVFVSANYKLSFDALREALAGIDAYILVLDTYGINVWCAAGKGNFSTDELVSRIEKTGLAEVVEHRRLIVPQLSATAVSAREVRERSGFKVTFGPVRAEDLGEFLKTGVATDEMRTVNFDLKDRAVLIPVEAKGVLPIAAGAAAIAHIAGDSIGAAGIMAASAAGLGAFPALLPYLPTEEFSIKGFTLGGIVGLGAAVAALTRQDGASIPVRLLRAASFLLVLPALTAFIGLNFTGCTTYTSPSGVRREIDTYVPVMAGMAGTGLLANIAYRVLRAVKG